MIHSSAVDNWERIELMHSIAKGYYELTKESPYRRVGNNISEKFCFDSNVFLTVNKESMIVEIIIAWCVITLESQVNHAIAATEADRTTAVTAIEYPHNIIKSKFPKSGLAKKISILAKIDPEVIKIATLADELSDMRNLIVHDKPFEIIDHPNGEVSVDYFRQRGDLDGSRYTFDDLKLFYDKCQLICDLIDSYYVYYSPMGDRVHFRFNF